MSVSGFGKKNNAWVYRWWDRYIDGIHGARNRAQIPRPTIKAVWQDYHLGTQAGIQGNAVANLGEMESLSFTKTQAVTQHTKINAHAFRWWDRYTEGLHSMRKTTMVPRTNAAPMFTSFYFGPTAGSSIAATLNVTLGSLTLSSQAIEQIAAALTKTLDALALSATGTVGSGSITGNLNVTLDGLTISSTGVVQILASLSSTLSALGLSAADTLKIQATLATLLGDLTLSATGTIPTLPINATLSVTLQDMILSATASGLKTGSTGGDGANMGFVRRIRGPHYQAILKEFEKGKLHSGSKTGPIVVNPKQARAIGYSVEKKKQDKEEKLDDYAMGNPYNYHR